jgi:MFS family permease
MESKKLTIREWLSFLLIGLAGQMAWAIENNDINLWVYSQTKDANWINLMTIFSAIAATLTTFLMGALSDRVGKRKPFIAFGYIIWGISVFSFGLFSYSNMAAQFGADKAPLMVGLFMVIMDCVMTFFGSTSNDACFNAYVTDITREDNRGKVESVLSVLPLFANILVVLLMGAFGATSTITKSDGTQPTVEENANGTAQPWFYFFLAFGLIVTAIGVVALFLLPKDSAKPNKEHSYWKDLLYGFKPSVIKQNKILYIALLAFMVFNTAINAFMPYWMVYFQNPISDSGLGFNGDKITLFYICFGVILVLSSIAVIVIGLFMDKVGKLKFLLPGLAVGILGFLGMAFSTQVWSLIISGTLMMSGYLIGTAVLGATVRDETPKDKVGLFQGVRMIFVVMVAMIVGSYTSYGFFCLSGKTYTDPSTFKASPVPSNVMFFVSLGFMVLAIIPSVWLILAKKKSASAPTLPLEQEKQIDQSSGK